MNTTERVLALLKQQGIAVSRLEKELGFSNGYIKGLKKGTLPSDRLTQVANYLGVSEAYLVQGLESVQSIFVITDSAMAPGFIKQDVITYEEGTSIKSEGMAIVRVGNRVIFRKVKQLDTGMVLMPLNPKFTADYYNTKDIQEKPVTILGRAISMERRL